MCSSRFCQSYSIGECSCAKHFTQTLDNSGFVTKTECFLKLIVRSEGIIGVVSVFVERLGWKPVVCVKRQSYLVGQLCE